MIYIVLGMHKSGTSLVSKMLHQSGIPMGKDLDEHFDYDTGNKYERISTFNLNRDILGYWNVHSLDTVVPGHLVFEHQHRRRMLEIIDQCEAVSSDWGFKDPCTCLTHSLWDAHLPDHKLIVVYRSPVEVWHHYKPRESFRIRSTLRKVWKTLRTWSLYNAQILEILQNTSRDYLVLSYGQLMSGQLEFRRLADFLDRELVDVRRQSSYRNRDQRDFLVSTVDLLMGVVGLQRPFSVMQALEMFRIQQVAEFEKSTN